jgi:hypothetical protein
MGALKRDPMGTFTLGSDGVLRSFDGPYKYKVIDAVGLSPLQLKQLLDTEVWSQERENLFRGVDGRKVTDYQKLFVDIPDDAKPQEHTEESLKQAMEEAQEKNKVLWEQMEKDRRDGINVEEKYACGRAISDFNLSPKDT